MYAYLIRIDKAQIARPTCVETCVVADLFREPGVLVPGLEQRTPEV